MVSISRKLVPLLAVSLALDQNVDIVIHVQNGNGNWTVKVADSVL